MLNMRRFAFFDKEITRSPVVSVLDVTAAACGRGCVVLGDAQGNIAFLDREFRASAHHAFKHRVNAAVLMRTMDVLVVYGDGLDARPAGDRLRSRVSALAARERARRDRAKERDAAAPSAASATVPEPEQDIGYALGLGVPLEAPAGAASDASEGGIIKVFRLDRRDARTGAPECIRAIRVFAGGAGAGPCVVKGVPEKGVTCLAVAEDMSQLALGCADGSILVLRSDFTRDKGTTSAVRVTALSEPSPSPVTFLAYHVVSGDASAGAAGVRGAPATTEELPALVDSLMFQSAATADGAPGGKQRQQRASLLSSALLGGARKATPGGAAAATSRGGMLCLYATTAQGARSIFTTDVRPPGMGKGAALADCSIVLDEERGCAAGCACVNDAGELVLGNDAGVFVYTFEDKRAAFPFPGRKQCVDMLRSHLVVAAEDERGRASITLYDVKCKFIAFSMTLTPAGSTAIAGSAATLTSAAAAMRTGASAASGRIGAPSAASGDGAALPRVGFLLKEWGQIFVVVDSGVSTVGVSDVYAAAAAIASNPAWSGSTVYQLRERDTGSKIEYLCKIPLFDVAATVASHSGYGKEHIADIHKLHGDFLYGTGEYDAAIAQYIKTVGVVEPSYVIRLFLESQRIHNLTTYLEALHSAKRAQSEHTTLLLNCYTKLRQSDKLRRFIRGAASEDGAAPVDASQLTFEVRTAISVLRDAQCYDEALYLAETHAEHDWYLRIQLEPRVSASDTVATTSSMIATADGATTALAYLRRMSFVDADRYMRQYGRELIALQPDATTAFLVMLCTRYVRQQPFLPDTAGSVPAASGSVAGRERLRVDAPEEFLPLFVDTPLHMKHFLRELVVKASVSEIPPLSMPLWHALLEVSLRKDVAREEARVKLLATGAPFSDADVDAAAEAIRTEDALDGVLRNLSATTEPDHCLLLCQVHDFRAGMLHLFERQKMYHMVLQHCIDSANAFRAAGRYREARAVRSELVRKAKAFSTLDSGATAGHTGGGSDVTSLWVLVLEYLTESYCVTSPGGEVTFAEDGDALFDDALKFVDAHNVLSPLLVVQLVAAKPNVPFRVVRDFIVRRLTVEDERISDDSRVIDSLRTDTHAMLNEVHRLKTQPITFQTRKCRGCGGDLDLPSIHFMCGGMRGEEHSFHMHCVNDVDPECPICAPSQRQVKEIQETLTRQAGSREQQEQFANELRVSADGFFKCAEFLGKGIFDVHAVALAETHTE